MKQLPLQKVSSSAKTKQWFTECAKAAVSIATTELNSIALSAKEKQVNIDLYDSIIDEEELKNNFDTMKLFTGNYSPNFKNYAVIRDKIDLLYGEYLERGEEYGVAAIDTNSISMKLKERSKKASEILNELLVNDYSEEEMKKKLKELDPSRFMSSLEKGANSLLSIVKKSNNLPFYKAEGFRESLITAQAIFHVGISNNRVVVRKTDPLNTYTVRSGSSNDVRDADVIVEIRYMSRGRIIDEFGEFIEGKRDFEDVVFNKSVTGFLGDVSNAELDLYSLAFPGDSLHGFMTTQSAGNTAISDSEGNLRVADITWAGYRKLFKRKYYGDNAEVLYDYVSEQYTPDKDKGEELTPRYVKEWYRATLVGSDLVVNQGVVEPRITSPSNPFESFSGYVGGYFNVVNNRAKSIVSLAAPHLYFLNVLYARVEDILSKNMGKIIELDLANIPDKWSVQQVMQYMKIHGIRVKDSFREGTRGAAQGRMAGMYNASSKPIDMEVGSSIQYIIGMMDKTEEQLSKITGITPQRLGAISNRELVGNVERSRIQSSHITEYWFNRYEKIMLDLNYTILSVAKQLVRDGVMFQSVLDDYSYSIFKEIPEGFNVAEFELFPVNTRKFKKLTNTLEQAVIQGLPNGQVTYTELIRLFKADSSFDMIVEAQRLDDSKEEKLQKAQEAERQHQVQIEDMRKQAMAEQLKAEKEYEIMLENIRNQGRLDVKRMELDMKQYYDNTKENKDVNANGVEDGVELVKEQMRTDTKNRELDIKEEQMKIDERIKLRELELKKLDINTKNKPSSK